MRRGAITAIALAGLELVACRPANFLYPYGPQPQPVDPRGPKRMAQTYLSDQLDYIDKVDILWVVDNSPSTQVYHVAIQDNIDQFITEFPKRTRNLRWKMGLISTAVGEDPYLGFAAGDELHDSTPGAMGVFRKAVDKLGENGDADEKSFDPVIKHLSRNSGFLRRHSRLALLIVTDEVEGSYVYGPESFVEALKAMKGSLDNLSVFLAYSPDEICMPPAPVFCPNCYRGSRYERMIQLTDGKVYWFCRNKYENFGIMMADVARELARHFKPLRIALDDRPRSGTIQVLHRGKTLPGGLMADGGVWQYDPEWNGIVFHDTRFLEDHDTIQVQYDAEGVAP